jgi:hypothetical protein
MMTLLYIAVYYDWDNQNRHSPNWTITDGMKQQFVNMAQSWPGLHLDGVKDLTGIERVRYRV